MCYLISIRGYDRLLVLPSVWLLFRVSHTSWFLDAFSHLYKRVCPFVRPSVGLSVGRSHTSWISERWAKFEQNSIRNKKVCHLKDDSKTSTRAVRQRTHLLSELCSTCLLPICWLTVPLTTKDHKSKRNETVWWIHGMKKLINSRVWVFLYALTAVTSQACVKRRDTVR